MFKSNKKTLLILGITSMMFSRVMFFFFDDPEGPNLLVVTVTAVIVYSLSLVVYTCKPLGFSFTRLKKLIYIIFIQILIVAGLYFCLS